MTVTEVVTLDANGVTIEKGNYVRCITDEHTWLDKGAVVLVTSTYARDGGKRGVHYETAATHSSSSIHSEWVERIDVTEEDKLHAELAWELQALSGVIARQAVLEERNLAHVARIRQLKQRGAEWPTSS